MAKCVNPFIAMFYFMDRDPEFSTYISGIKNMSCTGYTMKCDS